jgi:acyl-CoA thioesterase
MDAPRPPDGREGLVEHLGLVEERLAPGRVRCILATGVRHQNIQGVIHGSVTFAVLDTAMGHALAGLLEPGEFCATTQISVQFLLATRPGETLVAEGVVVRRGRRVAYLEGTCTRADGEVVARALGTWHVGQVAGSRPT